jgi:hypothetical protein
LRAAPGGFVQEHAASKTTDRRASRIHADFARRYEELVEKSEAAN